MAGESLVCGIITVVRPEDKGIVAVTVQASEKPAVMSGIELLEFSLREALACIVKHHSPVILAEAGDVLVAEHPPVKTADILAVCIELDGIVRSITLSSIFIGLLESCGQDDRHFIAACDIAEGNVTVAGHSGVFLSAVQTCHKGIFSCLRTGNAEVSVGGNNTLECRSAVCHIFVIQVLSIEAGLGIIEGPFEHLVSHEGNIIAQVDADGDGPVGRLALGEFHIIVIYLCPGKHDTEHAAGIGTVPKIPHCGEIDCNALLRESDDSFCHCPVLAVRCIQREVLGHIGAYLDGAVCRRKFHASLLDRNINSLRVSRIHDCHQALCLDSHTEESLNELLGKDLHPVISRRILPFENLNIDFSVGIGDIIE